MTFSLSLLDLDFLHLPEVIGSYLLQTGLDVIVIETGPPSTFPALVRGLQAHGLQPSDVTHILATHIHLDHAGAAGHLAQHGARVFAHPKAVPHLHNPSKLWASASRLYGEAMDTLWGQPLPIAADQLTPLEDGDLVPLSAPSLRLSAIDTPGHAAHHLCFALEGKVFTGDVAAVRLPKAPSLRLPTPPPEFDHDAWKASLRRLKEFDPQALYLTHFGEVADPLAHLTMVEDDLDELVSLLTPELRDGRSLEELLLMYEGWHRKKAEERGLDDDTYARYKAITPSEMNLQGLQRWSRKFSPRSPSSRS